MSDSTFPGSAASHQIITPECRMNRGDEGAWDEAVARCRAQYDAIVGGWENAPTQPTLRLILLMERPAEADPSGRKDLPHAHE